MISATAWCSTAERCALPAVPSAGSAPCGPGVIISPKERDQIFPQAFKNVLPALANEFIVLLKETSVAGYVAITDLTRAGDIIRGRTFSAFMPLIAVALIYLVIVMVLTWLVGKLERRLRTSEH